MRKVDSGLEMEGELLVAFLKRVSHVLHGGHSFFNFDRSSCFLGGLCKDGGCFDSVFS